MYLESLLYGPLLLAGSHSLLFIGVEYLVPSRRYTDPEERHKQYAKYIDPDKKLRGYLRWIEWALIALSSRAGSKAHKDIEAYSKSKR